MGYTLTRYNAFMVKRLNEEGKRMTKQEEIREGIEARIRLGTIDTTYETADAIVAYLHSQGVVIRHGEGEADLWVEPLIEEE